MEAATIIDIPEAPEHTGKSSLTTKMEEFREPEETNEISDTPEPWEAIEKPTEEEISTSAEKSSELLVTQGSGSPVKIQIDTKTEMKKTETSTQGTQTELSKKTIATQTGSDADDAPDNLPASRQQADALKSSQSFWWSAWASETASSVYSWFFGSPNAADHQNGTENTDDESKDNHGDQDTSDETFINSGDETDNLEVDLRTPSFEEKIQKIRELISATATPYPSHGSWWQVLSYYFTWSKHNVGIFSLTSESDYEWLKNHLRSEGFQSVVENVQDCYIPSNKKQKFWDDVSQCTFGILYHTKKRGRLNITDVTDSLYDEELTYISEQLGEDKVIVVIDDLRDGSEEEKERILKLQPKMKKFAREVFLFTSQEK